MNLKFIIIPLLFVAISCKQEESNKISEVEAWKLSWRMILNSMDENYELADLQFDSLRNNSQEIASNYLYAGLIIKSKLEKSNEVIEILDSQGEDVLQKICENKILSSMESCEGLAVMIVENKTLQYEIIKMYVDDQAVRYNLMQEIISKYNIDSTQITEKDGVAVDAQNRNRLKEIFKEFGFPTTKLVGKDAMQGIFLIIQHSDEDKEWQKSQLPNIKNAVERGDMNGEKYAYLYDRIKVNAGEKQLYGTQFADVNVKSKIVTLADTEDIENLDTRRMEFGMMPIEMYKDFMLKNVINQKK